MLETMSEITERIFSIDINQCETGDYSHAFKIAQDAGVKTVSLSINWDDVESIPFQFAPNPNWLAIANLYYPAVKTEVILIINPIDTNKLRLPDDLKAKSFDSSTVIKRFQLLVDYIFSQIPDLTLTAFVIGNEIDAYFGANSNLWKAYTNFLAQVIPYVKEKRQGLKVSTKITYHGYRISPRTLIESILEQVDVMMVTYYPLNRDFTVKNPHLVNDDWRNLLKEYPEKPVYMMEVGYPSSSICQSSEQKQAEFIQQVFYAWDNYQDRIKYINFLWLHDLSASQVIRFQQYYGLCEPKFGDFLRTLGLRTYESTGVDKKAFSILVSQAKLRNLN